MEDLLNTFEVEKSCNYKDETYHVRDNGSILRKQKPGKRKRPLDEKWSFGKPSNHNGYMSFSSETVHRIVASAFHGSQPSDNHVVDHIDTNKRNNRPENLRWVTKLENILLNPISLKKILWKYGSIDNFLENPSSPLDKNLEQSFDWMRTVTKAEAENTRKNLISWAKENKLPKGGELGEWIYQKTNIDTNPYIPLKNPEENNNNTEKFKFVEYIENEIDESTTSSPFCKKSKTPNAAEVVKFIEDKPNEFPRTPEVIVSEPLQKYYDNLESGVPFFRSHKGDYVVVKRKFSEDKNSILVMCRADYQLVKQDNGDHTPVSLSNIEEETNIEDMSHSLNEITFENDLYIHSRFHSGSHTVKEELDIEFEDYR